MERLQEIDWMFNTDKASLCHDYMGKYERYLPFERNTEICILEIGVLDGESLRMWRYWFPNAVLIGLDSNPKCNQYCDAWNETYIYISDQTNAGMLEQIAGDWELNLIIDDGSHINEHQIKTFEALFPLMAAGGMYVIEDTHTSYWSEYGGGVGKPGTCVEYFKDLIDEVNFYGKLLTIPEARGNTHYRRDDWMLKEFADKNWISKDILSINFMNSLIFIQKR